VYGQLYCLKVRTEIDNLKDESGAVTFGQKTFVLCRKNGLKTQYPLLTEANVLKLCMCAIELSAKQKQI
jgi:hypothetical protein